MAPAIEVKNVSKTFKVKSKKNDKLKSVFVNILKSNQTKQFTALKNINFTVEKGEFVSIIGKNGSGKSTLLKLIAQIYKPSSGKVIIHDKISPFLELGIGFNNALSGIDNIYLNSIVLGLSREQVNNKLEKIIKFSELSQFINNKLKTYSSGMRLKLAFSILINCTNNIFLMDEVLAVGDKDFKQKCMWKMKSLIDEGKTIVFVSHSMHSVRKYSNKVLLLNQGEVVNFGTPNEVLKDYVN